METLPNAQTYGIFSTSANRKLIERLESGGAKVVRYPPPKIELVKNADVEMLLHGCGLIMFPDIFAVDYFLENLENNETDWFELDEKRIAALGEAVADRLRFSQIHTDIIPVSLKSDDILQAIFDYFQTSVLNDIKILLPKSNDFAVDFIGKLNESGAEIFESEVYLIENESNARLKAFLTGGTIDAFIFSSPEDVFYLGKFLMPQSIPTDLQVFGTNEITLQTLREYSLNGKYFSGK